MAIFENINIDMDTPEYFDIDMDFLKNIYRTPVKSPYGDIFRGRDYCRMISPYESILRYWPFWEKEGSETVEPASP